MIDRTAFAKVMGVFADRIGRALAPATAEMYYDTLSEMLVTEEFLAGARIVFRQHQFNTWPAAQQFIDAAKPQPSPELAAAEAFEKVLTAVGSFYDSHEVRDARLKALGPVAERAYRAAGGFRAFMNVLEENLPFLRIRFLDAYTATVSVTARQEDFRAAIAAGDMDPKVAQLVSSTTRALSSGRDRTPGAA